MPFHNWSQLFSSRWDVAYPFMQTILAKVEWNLIRVKEDSVIDCISLNFHKMKSYLWIIPDNMDAIP